MPDPLTLLLLITAAFFAGLIDAVAGGGGLITVPVLMGIGLPPQVALGTNKLQASFGSGSAMLHFVRNGTVDLSECVSGIIWTAIGAATGVFAIQQMDAGFLKHLVPWLLVTIAIYTLFTPKLGAEDIHARLPIKIFYPLFGLTIGFYDGFFGPGTGSFWAMAFVLLLGCSLVRATAHTKVMNFTSNIVALVIFMAAGQVHYLEGLLMGAAQFIGAKIGANLVSLKGAKFIRPVFITIVLAITAKLLYQNYR
ncbi:MAG: TSUP family transporter [Geobacteraceae bacterium]|nr:TSUP family transporter [Geobacteraceae bacterium]